jgi:hypothetical protein
MIPAVFNLNEILRRFWPRVTHLNEVVFVCTGANRHFNHAPLRKSVLRHNHALCVILYHVCALRVSLLKTKTRPSWVYKLFVYKKRACYWFGEGTACAAISSLCLFSNHYFTYMCMCVKGRKALAVSVRLVCKKATAYIYKIKKAESSCHLSEAALSPGSIKADKFSAHRAHLCRKLLFARRARCKLKFPHSQVTDLFIWLGSRANERTGLENDSRNQHTKMFVFMCSRR